MFSVNNLTVSDWWWCVCVFRLCLSTQACWPPLLWMLSSVSLTLQPLPMLTSRTLRSWRSWGKLSFPCPMLDTQFVCFLHCMYFYFPHLDFVCEKFGLLLPSKPSCASCSVTQPYLMWLTGMGAQFLSEWKPIVRLHVMISTDLYWLQLERGKLYSDGGESRYIRRCK